MTCVLSCSLNEKRAIYTLRIDKKHSLSSKIIQKGYATYFFLTSKITHIFGFKLNMRNDSRSLNMKQSKHVRLKSATKALH